MKTLAVCIPTYRRPEFLARCIESAYVSAVDRPLVVAVADDSTDEVNAAVMQALMARHPTLSWHRNATNLGIDRNIQRAVDACEADFVWLIGEDDQFTPDAVARVHDLVQQTAEPFIFVNYQYVDADHTRVLRVVANGLARGRHPAEPFVRELLWMTGFIGACVVDRREFQRIDPVAYDGTYFTHVGRIVEMIAAAGTLTVEPTPCVANRAQGADTFTWKHDAFGVFTGFERMCRIAALRCPPLSAALADAAATYRRQAAYLSFRTSFRLRSEGALDLRQYRAYVAPMSIPFGQKARLLALAIVPSLVLRPFAKAYIAWSRARGAAVKSTHP